MNFIKDFYNKREIGRLEFLIWNIVVFLIIALSVVGVIFITIGSSLGYLDGAGPNKNVELFYMIMALLSYFIIVSSWLFINLPASIKRNRSVGINVWWVLLYFIPVVSFIYFLFLLLTPPGYFKPKALSTNPNPAPMAPPVSAETPTQTEDQVGVK